MNGFYSSIQEWIDAGMPMNSFICGDCMQGMEAMPEKFSALSIIDPPYGIGAGDYHRGGSQYGNSLTMCKIYDKKSWDSNCPSSEYFKSLFRVSINQIIFGANHFISNFAQDSSCWIVWDKDNGENGYADCELAWTSFKTAVRKVKYRWHGMLQQNMKCKEERIHPTQKPSALYRYILQNYANPGDIILDTHVGSASSLIACEQMGFSYVGFEIDRDYFDAACKRILQARELLKQQDMFPIEKSNGKSLYNTLELFTSK